MPITVIGGLISSTLLTLIVIPIVYDMMEGFFEKRKIKKVKQAADGKSL
jgi:HAE1 family hydrophobic/amphiphilic exporter-1